MSKALRHLAVVAALLVSGGAASAASLTRLPAAFRGNDVYIQVSLNGGAPVWMRFDPGASESALSATYVKDARQAARMTVRLGAVTLVGVFFDVSSASAGVAPDGSAVAGRLGEACLGDRVLMIRPRAQEVWLSAAVDTGAAPRPQPASRMLTASR